MEPRREKRWEHIAETIRFGLRDYWKVALLVTGLAATAIAYGFWVYRDAGRPVVEEEGKVVRFGSYSDSDGDHATVLVRLREGSLRQLAASGPDLLYCRVGGTIQILRGTDTLRVSLRGCTRLPS